MYPSCTTHWIMYVFGLCYFLYLNYLVRAQSATCFEGLTESLPEQMTPMCGPLRVEMGQCV